MKRLTPDSPELKSADLVAENIERLRELFPEAFANEGKIDFDVLRQLLGDRVDDGEERYGLNWHGKRAARQLALTPSTGTLRPCPEESVDWDTTQNIFIEGDNLEVLKLLQKSYAGKVKLIYIDPPYNTGKDFVYPDNFQDSIKNYLELTGQVEGGQRITSNTEASGRFHTDWLNMMYPRLKAAHTLLEQNGALLVSIGERELENLLAMLGDLFGKENQGTIFAWKSRAKPTNAGDAKFRPQKVTEYVVAYCRKPSDELMLNAVSAKVRAYPHEDAEGRYRITTILTSNRGTFRRETMRFESGGYTPDEDNRWKAGKEVIDDLFARGRIVFNDDGIPMEKKYEAEESEPLYPIYTFVDPDLSGTAEAGKAELTELLGNQHGVDTVKPVQLLKYLISTFSNPGDLVVDFFAGTGTTGQAVAELNSENSLARRFVLVQLPFVLSVDNVEEATTARFLQSLNVPPLFSEVAKLRLRKVRDKLSGLFPGDLGFRVYKLDSGNVRPWEASKETLADALTAAVDHVKPDRTEDDLLYDMILKHGLDICAPIDEKQIGSHKVRSVGGGAVFACFGSRITATDVEQLADGIAKWRDDLAPANPELCRVVFRDSAFETDVAKTNLALILKERGFDEKLVVSL